MIKQLSKNCIIASLLFFSFTNLSYACEWYDPSCWFDDGGGGGGGSVPDPLDSVKNLVSDIGNDVTDGFDDMNDGFNDVNSELNSQFSMVEGEFNQLTGSITDLYGDLILIANGIDPNLVANTIITEFQNESNCQQLPKRLDAVTQLIVSQSGIENLGLPNEILDSLNAVNFSQLSIIGIDPATATGEDLYYYKITTVKPLETLNGMTGSVFKIPFIIGSTIANACADATEFRIGQRDALEELHNQIHQELSSNKSTINIRFELPQSKGGNLEDVATVIHDVITSYQELGVRISNGAQHALEKGEWYYEQEQYHRAYRAYREAYRKLAGGGEREH